MLHGVNQEGRIGVDLPRCAHTQLDIIETLLPMMAIVSLVPPSRRSFTFVVHWVLGVELATLVVVSIAMATMTIIVVVLIVIIVTPLAAPMIEVRVVIIVAAPDSTRFLLSMSPPITILSSVLILLPRQKQVVHKALESVARRRHTINHPKVPAG
jgi:hypothetical protein